MIFFWIGIIGLILWAALLTIVCIWSRKDTWGRSLAMLLFAASIAWIPMIFSQTLGNPRPVKWEQVTQFNDVEKRLLGFKIEYEKAIYLYLDGPIPLSLVLPWNTETAEKLQGFAKQQEESEGDIMVVLPPFEKSLEDIQMFYLMPQQKLPDKPEEGGTVLERE